MLFVDAPLLVENAGGQRPAERQVGHRYGRWKGSANSTNLSSLRLGGVSLRQLLEKEGWRYDDGRSGPATSGRTMSECYPYTTIVGVEALGYDVERPLYKRAKTGMPAAKAWPIRTAACDLLIKRVAQLADHAVPVDLSSHATTRDLIDAPSPATSAAYKKREDLLDAVICAWTAALWHQQATDACQVLGADAASPTDRPIATIIAPARPAQRREKSA